MLAKITFPFFNLSLYHLKKINQNPLHHSLRWQKAFLSAFYLSQNVSRRVDKIPRMCTGIEQYGCPGFKVLETQGSIQVKSRFVSTLRKIEKKVWQTLPQKD